VRRLVIEEWMDDDGAQRRGVLTAAPNRSTPVARVGQMATGSGGGSSGVLHSKKITRMRGERGRGVWHAHTEG
jgi:hypothetical protein